MLFPTDPVKRPELWINFAEKIANGLISSIVHGGQVSPKIRGKFLVNNEKLIESFQSADIVRFFSSRGQAIGPFVALDVTGETARLAEYAIDTSIQTASVTEIEETFQSISIDILFKENYIKTIYIPFEIKKWEIDDWEATIQTGETVLRRTA